MEHQVVITQYKWAGQMGPFKIRSTCEECDMTTHRVKKIIEEQFQGRPVCFEIKPWLDHLWYCLRKGTYHPPIILINGKKFYQFSHRNPVFDQEKFMNIVNCNLRGEKNDD